MQRTRSPPKFFSTCSLNGACGVHRRLRSTWISPHSGPSHASNIDRVDTCHHDSSPTAESNTRRRWQAGIPVLLVCAGLFYSRLLSPAEEQVRLPPEEQARLPTVELQATAKADEVIDAPWNRTLPRLAGALEVAESVLDGGVGALAAVEGGERRGVRLVKARRQRRRRGGGRRQRRPSEPARVGGGPLRERRGGQDRAAAAVADPRSVSPMACIGPSVERLWVTLGFGDAYNTTQLVAVQSLSVHQHSKYPHATLVTPSPILERSLSRYPTTVVRVNRILPPWPIVHEHWGDVFAKLNMFRMCAKQVAFVDADAVSTDQPSLEPRPLPSLPEPPCHHLECMRPFSCWCTCSFSSRTAQTLFSTRAPL